MKGKAMKLKGWIRAIVLAGTLNAAAAKPPRMPVYYEYTIVTMTVVNDNLLGIKEKDHANISLFVRASRESTAI